MDFKKIAITGLGASLLLFPPALSFGGLGDSARSEGRTTTETEIVTKRSSSSSTSTKLKIKTTSNLFSEGEHKIKIKARRGEPAFNFFRKNSKLERVIDDFSGDSDGKLTNEEVIGFVYGDNGVNKGLNRFPCCSKYEEENSNTIRYTVDRNGEVKNVKVSPGCSVPQSFIEEATEETSEKQSSKSKSSAETNIFYLPSSLDSYEITKYERMPNNSENLKTYLTESIEKNGTVNFLKPLKLSKSSQLEDFIRIGLERPSVKGQIKLPGAYGTAILNSEEEQDNIGVSGLRYQELKDLVGTSFYFNGEVQKLTQEKLEEALRNHAIHEGVMRTIIKNHQKNDSQSLDDNSNILERDRTSAYTKTPVLRLMLPINSMLNSSNNYLQHNLTKSAEKNLVKELESVQYNNSPANFEQRIYKIISNKLLGGQE